MVDRISLDFTRFEARTHELETRMLKMEAFLAQTVQVVFTNETIVTTLAKELGDEKTKALAEAMAGYITELNERHGSGS